MNNNTQEDSLVDHKEWNHKQNFVVPIKCLFYISQTQNEVGLS